MFVGPVINEAGVALAEGAAGRVLARQADREALDQQGAEGERLGGGPVDAVAGLDHRPLGFEHALHGLVRAEAVGEARQGLADALEPATAGVAGVAGLERLVPTR